MQARTSSSTSMRSGQRGMATLAITVVLLAVMSLMLLYSTRSSILEVQLMGNAYRTKQATAAADAALDDGLRTYLADTSGTVPAAYTGTAGSLAWRVDYCTPTSTLSNCTAAADPSGMRIVATGYSDDGSAVHRESVLVASKNAVEIAPKAGLIARGALGAQLNGNLTIVNNQDNGITIWTGTDIGSTTGSFTTKVKVNGTENQVSSSKTKNSFTLGPDVIYNDQNLKNVNPADYIQNLLGTSITELQALADYRATSLSDTPPPTAGNDYHAGKIIYIDGDADITSAAFVGGELNQYGTPGSSGLPAILIVNGDLSMSANFDFYGIIIADNVVGANGTTNVYGSLITSNVNNVTGNLTITAESNVILQLGNIVKRTVVSASWRDWD